VTPATSAVFPIQKHEFSAGCALGRATQQSGPAGCTKGRVGELQKRAGRRAAEQGGPFDTRANCVKNDLL